MISQGLSLTNRGTLVVTMGVAKRLSYQGPCGSDPCAEAFLLRNLLTNNYQFLARFRVG